MIYIVFYMSCDCSKKITIHELSILEDRPTTEANKNTNLKIEENIVKTKKIKKMKKLVKKQPLKEKIESTEKNIDESQVNEQEIPPQQTVFERDDDFWDFYDQPFVQS